MSPLTLLWITSIIGAALFFASGYLSSHARFKAALAKALAERSLEPALALTPFEDGGAAESLRVELSRAEGLAQHTRRELEGLKRQLDVEISTKSALDRELMQSRGRADELQRKLTEAQHLAAALPSIQKKYEELQRAQGGKTEAVSTWERRVRELERELGETKGTADRLQTQLDLQVDGSTAALVGDVKRLEEEQQARNLRIKMLTHRVSELEAYAEQNTALRAQLAALEPELDRLRHATREPLASPAPRPQVDPKAMSKLTRPSQSGTTRRVNESERTLESSLKQHLTGLMTREPGLIAVLSDVNGFPVAGVGTDQDQEGVSVLTSLAQQLAMRVKEFVDLEHIERMELADVTGRALRVRFFDWEAQPLALGCLGKRTLVPNADEELVVTTFPKILRHAWSA